MSEFNFDNMKNVEIPDLWVKNTISMTPKKPEKTFSFRRRMVLAFSCVSFLLVCLISTSVFCFVATNDDIVLATENTSSHNLSTDSNSMAHSNTEKNTEVTEIINSESELQPTENQELSEETMKESQEETTGDENKKPDSNKENNKKPNSDRIPSSPNGVPSAKPDSSSGSLNSGSSDPNGYPSKDEKPEVEENTDPPVEDYWMQHYFPTELVEENEPVYCKIYSVDDEKYLGNPDFNDEKYRAEIFITSSQYIYARYYPVKEGLLTKNGDYIIYFCRQNGEVLCYEEYTVSIF